MTKEVKLRICGMHMHGEDGDRDDVEVISVGQMCERDGFAWITYEEVVEEEGKWTCLRCEKSGEIQRRPVRDYQAWSGGKPYGVCAK